MLTVINVVVFVDADDDDNEDDDGGYIKISKK